jgi:hypothetical protein
MGKEITAVKLVIKSISKKFLEKFLSCTIDTKREKKIITKTPFLKTVVHFNITRGKKLKNFML